MHEMIGCVFVALAVIKLVSASISRNWKKIEPTPFPLSMEFVRELVPIRKGGRIQGESELPELVPSAVAESPSDSCSVKATTEEDESTAQKAVDELLDRVAMEISKSENPTSELMESPVEATRLDESDPHADDMIIVDRHVEEWE